MSDLDTQDPCPNNPLGHRYFIYKTFEVYEPYQPTFNTSTLTELLINNETVPDLYQKKEYGVLGCNCGSMIKSEIGSL